EKDEEESIQLYEILIQSLTEAGYNQYEISNFSLPDYESKHNSSYWKNTPYIGLGASAHSYNGASRQWNIASVITYCKQIEENKSFFEIEFLTEKEKYNDFIITSLRTSKGVDLQKLTTLFGEKSRSYFIQQCQPYVHTNMLCEKDNFVHLTQKGIFVSDSILETLIDV
ncbi:MAG TPA: coproporphyrinogen III oxidase, partial [Paludibacteraceae bacterium]|nr:coproporphyrinogen III oxidase [Paludibacteraceae bacterium]